MARVMSNEIPGGAAGERPPPRAGACGVCGARDVRSDAVEQRGWWLLAECARCTHRWTQPLAPAPARAQPARATPEAACAA